MIKGSKARWILRPLMTKMEDDDGEKVMRVTGFKRMACLFPVSETEGAELPPYEPADWNPEAACKELAVQEIPFRSINGNVQGYSVDRSFSINPVAAYPMQTMFHELAHIQLGHTTNVDRAEMGLLRVRLTPIGRSTCSCWKDVQHGEGLSIGVPA